jgi:bifunctional non-homologous end joining protein LigD
MQHLVFVIHKHHATNLHYDFRLEINGVMPSWSIPKGPTLDNTLKRLAMATTDHDMEYRHFEGVIPERSYGAGPVMIWDEGYYIPEIEVAKGVRKAIPEREQGEKVMEDGLEHGELKFVLQGQKLKGSFALVKTKGWGPKNSWLLIKHNDEFVEPGYDANKYDFSAVSKKSLDEIMGKKEV